MIRQPRSLFISIMRVRVRKNPGAVVIEALRALVMASLFSEYESHAVVPSRAKRPQARLAGEVVLSSAAAAVEVSMNNRSGCSGKGMKPSD